MKRKSIRLHFHVSDNRETMSNAVNCCMPVDVVLRDDLSDDRKWLCDEKSFLRACSHER